MREGIFDSITNTMKSFTQLQSHLQKIFVYLKRYKKVAILAMVFVVLKEGAVLFEPYIYKEIIEVFERFYNGVMTRDETIRRSIVLVLGFISAQGVVIVANTLMLRTVNKLDASIMRDAANDFVAKVLNLSFRFHSDRKTGKMAKEFAQA